MAKFSISSTSIKKISIIGHSTSTTHLIYENWFSNNATIWIDNKVAYNFSAQGMWADKINLEHDGNIILSFKMNWKGELMVDTLFDGKLQSFIFKKTAKLNKEFGLYSNNNIIAVVLPDFNWDKFSRHYYVETTNEFDAMGNVTIMLYTLVYCTNYIMYKMYSPSM